MQFHPNAIYHIYNQGNNRQQIFFKPENYLFFLKKMREYLLPHGDLLCYCLMPNHFHWLMYVREVEVDFPRNADGDFRPSERVAGSDLLATQNIRRNLNNSINGELN